MKLKINTKNHKKTVFTLIKGKYTKHGYNDKGLLYSRKYKNEYNFYKAIKKELTMDSTLKGWNKDNSKMSKKDLHNEWLKIMLLH